MGDFEREYSKNWMKNNRDSERAEGRLMGCLRQMVEKRLKMQGRMAVGFVDLEKAYDTVLRQQQ